jgi:hypothetical protein
MWSLHKMERYLNGIICAFRQQWSTIEHRFWISALEEACSEVSHRHLDAVRWIGITLIFLSFSGGCVVFPHSHITFICYAVITRFARTLITISNIRILLYIFSFGSTAQFWALAASMKLSISFRLLDLGQSAGLLGRVISSSRGLYLYTNAHKTQILTSMPEAGFEPTIKACEH